jgi:hypothetical protein
MWKRLFAYVVILVALPATFLACDKNSPTEPTPPQCTYSLSASSLSFAASGGLNSVTVTTNVVSCTWSAASDRGWMSITSGASGTGHGTVTVSLTPNGGTATRTGTLTIAGQAVAVRQDGVELGACSFDLAPGSASYNKDSATGSLAVNTLAHCQWSASSSAGWLAVMAGAQGTGSGTVSYAVERNREPGGRTAAITVADKTFTVTQAGDAGVCDYSVAPVVFTPCMSVPYNLTATISAPAGCTWTVDPDASWITLTSARTGSGSATITFKVADNYDAPRQSVVKVRWPTVTAGQNLQVQQAGCRYGVSANTIDMTATGGTGRFDVLQQSEPLTCGGATQDRCVWTAKSDASWIAVTTRMPQMGDNPVSFTVAANTSTSPRTGTITVRDKVVRITQAGR